MKRNDSICPVQVRGIADHPRIAPSPGRSSRSGFTLADGAPSCRVEGEALRRLAEMTP